MSLINKMLQDLEARQGASSNDQRVYQDLRPVPRTRIRGRRRALGILLAAVTVGGPAAFYVSANLRPTPPESRPTALTQNTPPAADIRAVAVKEAAVAEPEVGKTAAEGSFGGESGNRVASPTPADAGHPTSPTALTGDAVAALETGSTESTGAVPAKAPTPAARGVADRSAEPAGTRPRLPDRTEVAKADRRRPTDQAVTTPAGTESLDKKIRPLTPRETAEDQYRRAARLIEQGRREEAASALRGAVAADAGHHPARELLAGLELQQGRWRAAEELLEAGLRESPQHYAFAQLLARVRVEHGAEEQALAVLEAAAPHAGRDPGFLSFLAALYQRAGRNAEAARTYRQAVALRDNDSRAWLGLAIALEAEGQHRPAADAYRRARAVGGLAPALDNYASQRLAALKASD